MRRIQIYDTTLRDGSQGEGVNFSLQDKLLITQRLDELGFDFIEGGYPLSNEGRAVLSACSGIEAQHAQVCAFGMTRRKGVKPEQDPGMKALLDSGAKTLTHRRQDFGLPRDRSAARHAGRKPGDDRRHGRIPAQIAAAR